MLPATPQDCPWIICAAVGGTNVPAMLVPLTPQLTPLSSWLAAGSVTLPVGVNIVFGSRSPNCSVPVSRLPPNPNWTPARTWATSGSVGLTTQTDVVAPSPGPTILTTLL